MNILRLENIEHFKNGKWYKAKLQKGLLAKKKKKGKKITFFFLKPFLENDDSKLLLYVKGKKKGYLVQLSLTKSDDGDGWHRHQSFHFNSNVLCTLVHLDSREWYQWIVWNLGHSDPASISGDQLHRNDVPLSQIQSI